MTNYRIARIVPVALLIIVAAVAVAVLVSIARIIFFSDSNNTNTSQTSIDKVAIINNTSTDRVVRMIVRGAIVADEDFRSYQIQISPNERTLTVYQGYLGQPINNITLGNNTTAYEQFVYALSKANLVKGTELTGDKNDRRGICSAGFVYEFQVLKADKSQIQLWTSSCSGSRGSLDANLDQLTNLFEAQIPVARTVIGEIWQ